MATRAPSLHDFFIGRPLQTQSDVAYANLLAADDASKARRANNVGRQVDLPGATVQADLPGFEQEATNQQWLGTLGADPRLTSFLVDPHNAASVKDDLPSLSSISATLNRAKDQKPNGFTNYMKAVGGQRPNLLSSIIPTGNRDYSFGNTANPAMQRFNNVPAANIKAPPIHKMPSLAEWTGGILSGTAGAIEQAGQGGVSYLADAIGQGDAWRGSSINKSLSAQIATDLGESQRVGEEIPTYIGQQAYNATQSIALMGASILTKKPIASLGLQSGLQQYQQVRDRGGSANEALFSGAVTGTAESAFERYFGLGWMLGNFGKKATGRFLGGLLLREVPSEVATTAVQDFADAMVTGGGGWEGYKQRLPGDLLDTAASTALMVGMMGAGHYVAHKLSPQVRAVDDIQRAAAGTEFVDTLMNAAAQSKTKAEDPETLRQFIDQHTADSPVRSVYVPVEAAVAYMQSENYKGELDRYQDQIEAAQATQGDVVIPISDAVAHLAGTPAWDALREDVRVEPGGLSRREATQQHGAIMDQLEARGKEIANDVKETQGAVDGAAEVYVEVKNRLRLAGVDDRQADSVAQIYAARYEARAAKRGGTAMEQFRASKISFPGETEGQPAGRNIAQDNAPLEGMPRNIKVGDERIQFGPFDKARQAAADYAREAGIDYRPPRTYARVDEARATRIAQAFEDMRHDPTNPRVAAAYGALQRETLAQWRAIEKTGLKVEFIKGKDPYGNPRNAILDVVKNNHLWAFPTDSGFGSSDADISGNPLLETVPGVEIDGRAVRYNDLFRIVHDYFGHIKEGVGFRADGEENAWRIHSAMFSPLARLALTTETRGQNSWVNFGPHGEANRTAGPGDTVYADQKIGLLPDWVSTEGLEDRTLNQDAALLGWQGLSQYLTDEEKEGLRERAKDKILSLVDSLPDAKEMAAAAAAGRAKRGWYEDSARAILEVFGAADAPRFAALLAALSPQTSVQSNLFNALRTWTLWNNEGRPTDRRTIVDIMGRSVEGNKGTGSVLNAWINNSITALAADDVSKIKLSGPKVDSFMSNLVGAVDEVTNDSWMANWANVDPTFVQGRTDKAGVKAKSPGYKAMNAVVRRAAEILSKKSGQSWTPAEVQETVWSFAKTLYEMRDSAGETRTMRELLKAGRVTHADIANTPDFAVLFTDGVFRTILEEGGYADQIAALDGRGRTIDLAPDQSVSEAEGTGFTQRDLQRFLNRAADRLEEVRARRQAQSRVLNQDVLPEAGWTPERVSGLIDQHGNEDGSSTAVAVMMSPEQYLRMNASAAGREMIAKRVAEMEQYGGALNVSTLQESPPIYLGVALGGENDTRPPPMVRGHDGRHRMELLRQAGIARVPVIVMLTDKEGKTKSVSEPIKVSNIVPNRSRSSQMENGDLTGEIEGVPISWRYQDQLAEMGQRVLFQSNEDIFYSAAERVVEGARQEKATAEQWAALLTPGRTPGIKAEEIEWTGILDWLKMQQGQIDKGALLQVLRDRGIKVEEVVLGRPMEDKLADYGYDIADMNDMEHESNLIAEANNTQFQSWSSDPNNESYRELLITLPMGEGSNPERAPSTHWDTEGVVAHVRFMEKTDADGKRVLFIEEVQSDWHQKGRDQGYEQAANPEQKAKIDEAAKNLREVQEALTEVNREVTQNEQAATKMAGPLLLAAYELRIAEIEEKARENPSITPEVIQTLKDTMRTSFGVGFYEGRDDGSEGYVGYHTLKDWIAVAKPGLTPELADTLTNLERLEGERRNLSNREHLQKRELDVAREGAKRGIPDAPFKASWPALVMKRTIRWAVDHGIDRVAWTTGEEQASRYNLSSATGPIAIATRKEGDYFVRFEPNAMTTIVNNNLARRQSSTSLSDWIIMSDAQIKEAFGNDVSKRLIDGIGEDGRNTLDGDNLNVGGEGMKAFYDRNLVNITNDIIKKYGVKVERNTFITGRGSHPVNGRFGFDITPKLRDAASSGFSLFQGPRGQTSFQDSGAKIISLFATADRSTLLHETGHIWLEELKADATAPDATDQDKADWETVKKWFAAQGQPVVGDQFIPTEAHEFWARGVERYFMEGKSPNAKLAGVFRTFKAWLLKIYNVVQNLNTPITPEIREVFDRLIATQDAIDDARSMNASAPLFKTAEEAGMTAAEFADYQVRVANARDEAYDALLFKTMEKLRRERTEEVRRQKAGVRAEVAEQVNRQPQFRLLHLLRTGKWLGEPERAAQPVKLNTGWLIDNYGESILDQLPRGIQIWAGAGETGDVIAEMVGLGSGSEVVQTLVGMRAASDELRRTGETRSMRDRLIAEETDRIMAERHGDTLTDGSIEEEAIAAINSARQGEIIASEARQLAKRKHVLGVPTPYQFAREWARRTVSAGNVRDVASRAALQRYIRNTNKAAKAAEEAILAGDIDEAYRQKQAQLLSHALLAEAKAAADRIDKIVARMRKLAGRAAMKSVDPAYMLRIHDLLESYDFRPRSEKSINEQEDFQEWLERQRAKGFEVHIPPRLENNGTPYSRVSVQELESLNDLVESLVHVGRVKQKIKIAQKERDFSEIRDNVVARIKGLKTRKLPDKPINEETRKLAAMAAELLKVETIAEELDGGPTGPLHDVLVLGATTAENLRHDLRHKVLLPLAQMYKSLGRKYWAHLQERVTIPELTWNTLNEGDPRLGDAVTVTRSELLAIFMNMGNLSNLEKMSKGERWPVETLRAVMDRELTKEDYDFAQQLWDKVGELWPDIVRVEQELSGVVPERVVDAPIQTPHSKYRGGYWPVVYDASRWQVAEDLEGKQIDDMFGMKSGVSTQKGHTVSRTAAFGPINLSIERVLFSHLEQVVTRIAYAPYARDVLRIVRDRTIRGWIDTKLGPEYRKQIEPWLGRQIHQGYAFPKGARWWDHLMRQFRVNMTIAAMGFRISTGTAQVLGLTASAQRIGAKWVGVGMKRLAQHPLNAARFAYAKSPELYHRTEAVNREVAEVANRMRGRHKWWGEAQHWAMWHIGMVDRYMVALPTWLGAYEKGMQEMGLTDEQAVAYADKSVRMSQGTGREKDMSAVQSPNSEAMRFFTMFYTPFNVMFNAQWQGVRGLKDPRKSFMGIKGDPRPMIAVTWWWLMMSTLGDALLSGDWPEFDEPESIGKWFGRNVFFGLWAGIPVARDFANWSERKVTGQYATEPGNTPITRVSDAINQAWNTGKRKFVEGEDPKNPIKQTGDLTAVLFGIPTSQAGATSQFAWDFHEGKTDPKSVSDWYFGITKGKVPKKSEETAP